MKYIDYIEFGFKREGFKREDISDSVVFKETGYHGYNLEKKLKEGLIISVSYPDLGKPVLLVYYGENNCHWIPIECRMIKDLIDKFDKI